MSNSETWCWTHMDSSCIVCERDQLKKIIEDAIKLCDKNIKGNIYDSFDLALGREYAADEIKDILKRTIKPTMYQFDENGIIEEENDGN